MKTLAAIVAVLLLATPAVAQRAQDEKAAQMATAFLREKGLIGQNQEIVIEHSTDRAVGVGAGGSAVGEKATLDVDSKAPNVATPWGHASGGDSSVKGLAQQITGHPAFRWIVGGLGLYVAWLGYGVFTRGMNPKGGAILLAGGVGITLGAAFAPEWLLLLLAVFAVAQATEYAHRHNLLTGSLASVVTAVHAAAKTGGQAFTDAFHAASSDIVEDSEKAVINRTALRNGAKSVEV